LLELLRKILTESADLPVALVPVLENSLVELLERRLVQMVLAYLVTTKLQEQCLPQRRLVVYKELE
jgi:DNA-binding TFAR19-related protein (PDSD5 family)